MNETYVPQAIRLVKQIGKKIQEGTGEKLSTFLSQAAYLYGNANKQCCLWRPRGPHVHNVWKAFNLRKKLQINIF